MSAPWRRGHDEAAVTRSEKQARGQQSDNYAQRWLQLSLAELELGFLSVWGERSIVTGAPEHPVPCPSTPCRARVSRAMPTVSPRGPLCAWGSSSCFAHPGHLGPVVRSGWPGGKG